MHFLFISRILLVLVLWIDELALHAVALQPKSSPNLRASLSTLNVSPSSLEDQPSAAAKRPTLRQRYSIGKYGILAGQSRSEMAGLLKDEAFKRNSDIHTAFGDLTTQLASLEPTSNPLSTVNDELEKHNGKRAKDQESVSGSKTKNKQAKTSTKGKKPSQTGYTLDDELCTAKCKICRSSGLGPQKESHPKLMARLSETNATNSITERDWGFVDAPKIIEISRDPDGKPSSELSWLGESGLTMGQIGLHGCTSVVIVSKYAVYMSHFYEVPYFVTFKNGKDISGGYGYVENDFRKGVLGYLGKSALKKPEFLGSKEFPKPGTQAIIISPSIGTQFARFKHTKPVNLISEELKKALKLSKDPIQQTYSPNGGTIKTSDGPYDSAPDGKLVFVYDPGDKESGKDCKANATAALFLGDPEDGKAYPSIFNTHWMRKVHGGKCPDITTVVEKATETAIKTKEVVSTVTMEQAPKPTGIECEDSRGSRCGGIGWWSRCNRALENLSDGDAFYGTREDNDKGIGTCDGSTTDMGGMGCTVFVEGNNCQVRARFFGEVTAQIQKTEKNPEGCDGCGSALLDHGCRLTVGIIGDCANLNS